MNNILVTGSNGQLGYSIKKVSRRFDKYNFIFTEKNQLDLSNFNSIEKYIINYKINIIINCAAYTDVENAENNRELVDLINHVSVENLAKICSYNNIQLIHISTDFIFDGNKDFPYTEKDDPNPINFYGLSKLYGERKILKYDLKKSVIIRTSWLYSELKNNFVNKIIEKINLNDNINVVNNELGSPTYAIDLANMILEIIPKLENNQTEIYHFSNIGVCSRYEFAKKINSITLGESKINSINSLDSVVRRPEFSALDSSKAINEFGIHINTWEESLIEYLKEK
jgi:dTDP-4-dehydrorhamnose reductase